MFKKSSNDNVEKRFIKFLKKNAKYNYAKDKKNGKQIMLTDIGLNSYEVVELICKFEKEFNVTLTESILKQLKTVQDLYALIIE